MSSGCEECDVAIIGDAYHLIFGGRMFRFCCHLHRQKFRKVLLSSVVNSELRQKFADQGYVAPDRDGA